MSDPYLGEIRMFGGSFAPVGWAMCHGQLVPISQNDALFNLIGTTYGGDGQNTFALPDLRGRAPVHQGQGKGITQDYLVGETGGVESVTLSAPQLPAHTHALVASTDLANNPNPTNQVFAQSTQISMYTQDVASKFFAPAGLSSDGGNQPHDNMQPFLVLTFIIALNGVFPSQG